VKSKIFQNGHQPATSATHASFGTTATAVLSIVALSSTCIAQTAAVVPPTPLPAAIVGATIPTSADSISRVVSGSETLHVIVGHSLFLNTKLRLHRIYIADPAVLNSITVNPNQIIVTAMTPGVSSLILLDETGQAQSYLISSDLDVQGLRTAMSEAMHDNVVNVEGTGDRVTLSGKVESQALADTAVKLAGLYSKDVANSLTVSPEHPKQVRLKVRILEVDRSKLAQFGVNLFNPGGNTSFLASTTTSQFPSTATLTPGSGNAIGTLSASNPLNFLLYSSKLNLGLTVQDLESKNVLQILAEPTITTISGEKASFLSGGEFPFPVIQPGGGGASASVTISFKPYGVKLDFTPIVNDDGTIRLKVAPEVSALDYTNTVTISGYTIPALSTRKADTEVELRSGQSFAISGLLDQRTTDLLSKTPGASSIPILGALFKSKNTTHSTTELVVVITPTLVDPLSEMTDPKEPDLPIPTLNTDNFDKSLGKRHNPNPAAPPMNPSEPPAINQVTPPAPVSTPAPPPAASATQDVTPVPSTPQSVPAPASSAPAVAFAVTTASSTQPAGAQLSVPNAALPPPSGHADVAVSSFASPSPIGSEVPQRYVFDSPIAAPVTAAPRAEPVDVPVPAMVQIMALSHREDADAMVAALKRHGYDVSISQDSHDSLLHLEVGPFKSKTDAEAVRHKLMTDGYNATIQ
jgi:pilus assembly protein CpaC